MEFPGDELDHHGVDVNIHAVNDSVHKAVLAAAPVAGYVGGAVRGPGRVAGLYLQHHLIQILTTKKTNMSLTIHLIQKPATKHRNFMNRRNPIIINKHMLGGIYCNISIIFLKSVYSITHVNN